MNLTKKTILALGLIAAAGASYAQTTSTGAAPVGVLGQSFSEVHFGVTDIEHYSKDQYGLGVAANVPVSPYLDLGAGYDYGWIRGNGHFNGLSGTANAYTTFAGVKPYVGAGVGYQWESLPGMRDNFGIWGVSAGVEIPAGVATVTPRIVYADDFRSPGQSSQSLSYGVEANYWVTKSAAAFASIDYADVRHSSNNAWEYTVGARFKF